MGWSSTYEDIQDRRDDAEYFRAASPAEIQSKPAQPSQPELSEKRIWAGDWVRRRILKKGGFLQLANSLFLRGGKQRWTGEVREIFLRVRNQNRPNSALQIDFQIPSKGGGITELSGRIGREAFPLLVQAMIVADRQLMIKILEAELRRQQN